MSQQEQETTMQDAQSFWAWAQAQPQRLALVTHDHQQITAGELLKRVNQLSHGLRAAGLGEGDLVALMAPNDPVFFELFLATSQIGMFLSPINYHLSSEETSYILHNSDARLFVAHGRCAAVAQQAATAAGIQRCYWVGEPIPGFEPYENLLQGQPATLPEQRSAGTLMLYTSGTTGKPKGVRRSLPGADPEVMASLTSFLGAIFDIPSGTGAHLLTGPLYHATPSMMGPAVLHMGVPVVIMDKWTPEGTLERIARYRITSSNMVPTMFHRMLKLPEAQRTQHDLSSLRSVITTGAPCPQKTKEDILDWWGDVLYELYGGTEGVGTTIRPEEARLHPGSVGRAIPGSKIFIMDDTFRELPPGEVGTVYILPILGDFEYYKDAQKTQQVKRGDLITVGDVGYLDEEGWLHLTDRKIDMIISGGVNIYPAEIEAILIQHPLVADVAVFGIPDEEWGESIKAAVETAPGIPHTQEVADTLLTFAAEHIARYKVPRSIDFVAELPRLPSGKVLKRRLRAPYWEASGRQI